MNSLIRVYCKKFEHNLHDEDVCIFHLEIISLPAKDFRVHTDVA